MGSTWITAEQRDEVLRLKSAGWSTAAVAARLDVCKKTIERIIRNDSWRRAEHIPPAHRKEHLARIETLRKTVQAHLDGGPQS